MRASCGSKFKDAGAKCGSQANRGERTRARAIRSVSLAREIIQIFRLLAAISADGEGADRKAADMMIGSANHAGLGWQAVALKNARSTVELGLLRLSRSYVTLLS